MGGRRGGSAQARDAVPCHYAALTWPFVACHARRGLQLRPMSCAVTHSTQDSQTCHICQTCQVCQMDVASARSVKHLDTSH